jgi:tRNA-Thr(GGU) m(6)t(6)A37 methyltransferase TsaA
MAKPSLLEWLCWPDVRLCSKLTLFALHRDARYLVGAFPVVSVPLMPVTFAAGFRRQFRQPEIIKPMSSISLHPIGVVRSPIHDPVDDVWGGLISTVELDPALVGPEATLGLAEFSHIQVLFHLHQVREEDVRFGKRHPRGRKDWPEVGILAQRARVRPNRLGLSTCRLIAVDGLKLTVENLDAIDGTPVVDVKPYMTEFGPSGEVRQPQWSTELMKSYFEKKESGDRSQKSE